MGHVFDRLEELEKRVAEIERKIQWHQVFLVALLLLVVAVLAVALWGHG